jgi:hypothetical protein
MSLEASRSLREDHAHRGLQLSTDVIGNWPRAAVAQHGLGAGGQGIQEGEGGGVRRAAGGKHVAQPREDKAAEQDDRACHPTPAGQGNAVKLRPGRGDEARDGRAGHGRIARLGQREVTRGGMGQQHGALEGCRGEAGDVAVEVLR